MQRIRKEVSQGKSLGSKILIGILIVGAVVALGFLVIKESNKNQVANNGSEHAEVVSGTGQGFKGDITATVTYELGRITDLKLVGLDETPEIGGAALDTLEKEILQNGSTNSVDAVSGATYTSQGAFDAIADAMSKLKGR